MPRAALFDIDGTLVDSVDAHAHAWEEAFARFGKQVSHDEIRSQIGKGGDQLIPFFLTDDEIERFGDDLDEYRAGLYERNYLPWVQPFPRVPELLARLEQAGMLVALASSCRRTELGYYLRMVGGASLVDAAATSDDAEESKPAPDVFQAALDRLEVEPSEAIAVGDSPYDVEAAARAGVATVGLLCGGFEERVLQRAGSIAIFQDPADLLDRLDASPLAPEQRADHHR
jgi:HAD superfamily hydrolase (TIGR01509 family)